MWLEVVAYDDAGRVVFESGRIADDQSEVLKDGANPVWFMHEEVFDARGEPTHMFWEVAKSARYPEGYIERALPGAKTAEAGGHSRSFSYRLPFTLPRRAEFRVRMRPVGFDVLEDLVASKHLDPAVIREMPTFTIYSATVEWNPGSTNPGDLTLTQTSWPDCESYRCMYDPAADGCR